MYKKLLIVLVFSFIIPQLDWKIWLDMFPEIREVAICESNINSKALNKLDTDGLPAKGLLQFKDKTFYKWAKLAGIDKPDIWNPWQQIVLYRWADEKNLSWHWGCYNKLAERDKNFKLRYVDL